MVTKNLSNDFMAKVLEDAAWKELSGDFAWNEQLLENTRTRWNGKRFPATVPFFGLSPCLRNSRTGLTGKNSPGRTTSIYLRQKTWRNTRTIGTGGNYPVIPI